MTTVRHKVEILFWERYQPNFKVSDNPKMYLRRGRHCLQGRWVQKWIQLSFRQFPDLTLIIHNIKRQKTGEQTLQGCRILGFYLFAHSLAAILRQVDQSVAWEVAILKLDQTNSSLQIIDEIKGQCMLVGEGITWSSIRIIELQGDFLEVGCKLCTSSDFKMKIDFRESIHHFFHNHG